MAGDDGMAGAAAGPGAGEGAHTAGRWDEESTEEGDGEEDMGIPLTDRCVCVCVCVCVCCALCVCCVHCAHAFSPHMPTNPLLSEV